MNRAERAEVDRVANKWAKELNRRGIPAGLARVLGRIVVEDGQRIERHCCVG